MGLAASGHANGLNFRQKPKLQIGSRKVVGRVLEVPVTLSDTQKQAPVCPSVTRAFEMLQKLRVLHLHME